VQPERISSAGNALVGDGEQLLDQLSRFETSIAAYDGAWGDDTIGTFIGAAYMAIADWALNCWTEVAEEFSAAGEDVVTMGDGYLTVEKDNAQHLNDYYPPAG